MWDVAESIEQKLAEGEMQEAWRLLKGWYRSAEDRLPKPCHEAMVKQTKERETLYVKVSPPGDPQSQSMSNPLPSKTTCLRNRK
jgi:hypothetical protein